MGLAFARYEYRQSVRLATDTRETLYSFSRRLEQQKEGNKTTYRTAYEQNADVQARIVALKREIAWNTGLYMEKDNGGLVEVVP
jgi:hypothetical protein